MVGANGIKAQRLPGDIGLDTGKERLSAHQRFVVSAHFGQLAFEQLGSEDLAVAVFAEADSRASRGACRKTQINALLVISLEGT